MKPIAYVSKEDLRDMETHLCDLSKKPDKEKIIPIYTFRELTDEEIMGIYDREELYNIDEGQMYIKPIEFAKALLKKAIEK